MDPKKTDSPLKQTGSFFRYSSLALQMVLTMLLFVLGGFYLDKWLQLGFPWFTLFLTLAGVAGSLYSVIRKL
ncbi:MAG: AtpZ/AtpI family protein [Bacteroidetes bacterium]|jgi:F0F1-type ATP synthase assembly protein I|nr:AtpZ/AtpI family protein [Bacteroidota bacterium]